MIGIARLACDRKLTPLQLRPLPVAIDKDPTVPQDVREEHGRLFRISKGDKLNTTPARPLEPARELRAFPEAVASKPDEYVEIAIGGVLTPRDAPEDHREPDIRLRA
jgi:hypothetical protein